MSDFLKNVEKGTEGDDIRNPLKDAQSAMQPVLPKRFYKTADIAQVELGYQITLDGRPIKTPGKNPVILPTGQAAEILRKEWQDQETVINPVSMPASRLVNTAIDGVKPDIQPVLEDVVKYAGSDMLCYRAGTPEDLVNRQGDHWDPLLDWARDECGANFVLVEGIMHAAQPKEAIAAFGARLKQHRDPIAITCIHTFTSLTGSAIIGLAMAEGQIELDAAWKAANVDEDWNMERWGEDFEALKRRDKQFQEISAAYKLFFAIQAEK